MGDFSRNFSCMACIKFYVLYRILSNDVHSVETTVEYVKGNCHIFFFLLALTFRPNEVSLKPLKIIFFTAS